MWPSGLTLAMTLTLDFQGQIWNWLYLCEKWSDCHETKSKHIDWTLGLKCDHQIWPWPWPWPWIFKVKYEICYISTKSGPIATKWKANISIWTLGLKYDNGFDLGHDLDIWISRSYVILTIWWPRSSVRIYQIVTGVTSDVGVPSTHLVQFVAWISANQVNISPTSPTSGNGGNYDIMFMKEANGTSDLFWCDYLECQPNSCQR